jgi:hypothetical protein
MSEFLQPEIRHGDAMTYEELEGLQQRIANGDDIAGRDAVIVGAFPEMFTFPDPAYEAELLLGSDKTKETK